MTEQLSISVAAAGPFRTNTYFLRRGDRAVVVDPGMHAADYVTKFLDEQNLTCDAIVLSHGHIDHFRDAGALQQRLDVPVYIHADDEFMLPAADGLPPEMKQLFDVPSMTPVDSPKHLVAGETLPLLGADFVIHHAPGHSPGSVLMVAAKEGLALVGDVIFRGSIGRTDLPASDPAAMQETLAGPVWALDDSLDLLPGHGPRTTMAHERATNPFLFAFR